MSRSQVNAPALSATEGEIRAAMRRFYTDPDHLRVTDLGRVQGNVEVAGRDALDPDRSTAANLNAHDHRGDPGDAIVKQRLKTVPLDRLAPIRARRVTRADRPDDARDILRDGIRRADGRTQVTLDAVTDGRDGGYTAQ